MPVSISVPTVSSYTEQPIELDGKPYTFVYKLNERILPSRLYLDIYLQKTLIKSGIKLIPSVDLTDRYILTEFIDGALYLLRYGSTGVDATLGTIGFNLEYELVYFSNSELKDNV